MSEESVLLLVVENGPGSWCFTGLVGRIYSLVFCERIPLDCDYHQRQEVVNGLMPAVGLNLPRADFGELGLGAGCVQ